MQDYVLGLAFNADRSKMVLIRKNRPTWQAGKLNGVGGKIEFNERAHEALVREFREECGLDTRPEQWYFVAKLMGVEFTVLVFRLESDEILNATSTTDEQIEVSEVDLNKLVREGVPNLAWLVAACLDPNHRRCEITAHYLRAKLE